jgi:uncharacterized membrane protein
MANGGKESAKWIGVVLSIIVLFAGVVASYTTTQTDVKTLKAETEKKVNRDVYETDTGYIKETLKEIKADVKAIREKQ